MLKGKGPPQLPFGLALELQHLRWEYARVLGDAGVGRYEEQRLLGELSRRLGQLLAREARRPLEERGLPMRELSLAVAGYFPELQEWSLNRALERRLGRRGLSA